MSWTPEALGAAMTRAVKHLEKTMQILRRKYEVEKVQISQFQKDDIKRNLNEKSELKLLKEHMDGYFVDGHSLSLKNIGTEDLIKVLYVPDSYEVIPQYKVGDWVVYVPDNSIWEITKDTYNDGTHINLMNGNEIMNVVSANHLRHATPEEIQQAKKRRFWDKLGREVDEFREGDLVHRNNPDEYGFIYKGVRPGPGLFEIHFFGLYGNLRYGVLSSDNIRLITPVEQRLDK